MPAKPTGRQLSYLRALANRAGQTFIYPHTRREASREIQRLKQAGAATRAESREIEREIADAMARGEADAARVQEAREVTGYGSTATWKERS